MPTVAPRHTRRASKAAWPTPTSSPTPSARPATSTRPWPRPPTLTLTATTATATATAQKSAVAARVAPERLPAEQSPPAEVVEPATEPPRVLAAVEPSPTTEQVDLSDGPAPVPSQTELDEDYVQESPEELGADPLPGVDLTQPPPTAAE